MDNGVFTIPSPRNETVLNYAPGSRERADLQTELQRQQNISLDIPLLINGKEIHTSSFLMTFANAGQFGNNVFISPDAKIDDGLLDFCLISPFPQILAPLVGAQALSKTINSSHFYEMTRVVEAQIIRERSGWVHFDGEPVNLPKEVEFKAIPAGIKIMQPTEKMLKKPLFPGLLN